MVTDDSQSLDEYILQIFEEQEEVFYFPVTSQNTARSFVKALHNKGLPYERVCKEIGEFEHNFSAWRKGLGRAGIGHRVIQRINRPLEAVLLSDDEDDVQDILLRLKDRVRDTKRHVDDDHVTNNDRVPPVGRHRDASQPIREDVKSVPSGGGKNRHDLEQGLTESWRHCIDAKSKTLDDAKMSTADNAKVRTVDDAKARTADDTRTRTADVANGGRNGSLTTSPQLSRTSSIQLSRTPSSQLSGAELEQKEPGVIDFRSVLKRHVENDKLKLSDRRSMPPSLRHDHNNDTRSRLSTSLDTIHRADNTVQNIAHHEPSEGRKTRAGSEPRDTQYHVEAERTKENATKVQTTERSSEARRTADGEERTHQQTRKMSDSDRDLSDSDDSNQEPLPPDTSSTTDARKEAPLAAEESDSVSSETTSATESESESEKTGASSHNNDYLDGRDDNIHLTDDDDSGDDDDDDGDDAQEIQETDEVISENYDSEWDEENSDLSVEGRRLASQIAEYKRRLSQSDGAGFIWVFTDNPGDTSPRIKIGASRFPKRRLKQALCLNINMTMLVSFRVRSRKEMLEKVRESLQAYRIGGHKDWYQGEITDLLDIIKTTIRN